ncbi:hypothetical protein BC567DRAFT_275329 [Phyllosticta citribraziliensis]
MRSPKLGNPDPLALESGPTIAPYNPPPPRPRRPPTSPPISAFSLQRRPPRASKHNTMKTRQTNPSRLSGTALPKTPFPQLTTLSNRQSQSQHPSKHSAEPATAPGARRSAADLELHHPVPKRPAIRHALENFERRSDEFDHWGQSAFSSSSSSSSAGDESASEAGGGDGDAESRRSRRRRSWASWDSERSRGRVVRTLSSPAQLLKKTKPHPSCAAELIGPGEKHVNAVIEHSERDEEPLVLCLTAAETTRQASKPA